MLKLDYDEISPITGNKTVLCEYDANMQDTTKICMATGYQTYLNSWKQGSDLLSDYELQLPTEVLNSKVVDSNGNVWYKTVLQSPRVILYPKGEFWKVVPLSESPNEVDEIVPIIVPIGLDNRGTRYLELSKAKTFDSDKFEEALFSFQELIADEIHSTQE